jgi:predicted nucleic acid-binding protein
MKVWLVDTGPLIAFLSEAEAHHDWTVEQMKLAPPVIHTCEAVVTETLFLLARDGFPPEGLFALVESGLLRCTFDFQAEHRAIRALMRKYHDTPMSYADACLVRLAELNPDCCLWTLDKHFRHYRRFNREMIPLVAP